MTIHTLVSRSCDRFVRLACAAVFSFGLALSLGAAEAAKKNFDLPAGDAATTLKVFTQQSGEQIVYPVAQMRGVRTNAVKGELATRDALDQMLKDTGLTVVQDEKTGALAVKRESDPNAPRVAQMEAATPENQDRIEDGRLVLDTYEVTGRVDGLNNKGLLQGGENAALYHDVISRVDIERMGISSLEELFRYLPQTSSATTSLQEPSGNARTSGGLEPRVSTVGLRGFASSQTVILVNGRALPRSSISSSGGPDISRIPLAAIERVELLPYAGSAIYGAGAIGGAINIILRKDYTGRDLTTYVGTSTEGGATEYRFTYLEGRSFNDGKTRLTLTLSHHHRDPLRANQRGFLAEALRRYGPGSTAVNNQGVPIFEQSLIPAFAGTPATIVVGNAPSAAVNDLGIPGAPGVRFAAVPAGTTAAQSFLLTPASFTGTAGQANLSPRFGRSVIYEPVNSYSINAQVEHVLVKDKLSAYGEFTLGYNRRKYDFPQSLVFSLTATDPLNPFRTGVTPGFVGRPVTIYVDTPDIRDPSIIYENESARAVLGLKGKLTTKWEWSVDGAVDYTHSYVASSNPPDNLTALQALSPFASPGPAAPATVRRAVYPLFADHGLYPISEEDSLKYFDSMRNSASHGTQLEGNARLLGEIFQLPAGPLRTSAVGKYKNWDFVSGLTLIGSDAYSQLINNQPATPSNTRRVSSRGVTQGALEVVIPVIGKKWRPVPIQSFEIQGSYSREDNKTSGLTAASVPFTNKQSSDSSVIAGRLQITRDLAFRASHSEGFYPPDWNEVSAPTTNSTLSGAIFADPKRGNTRQGTPNISLTTGGNPDLQPETATSNNLGLIFTPRFLPGFTLNVDYWRIRKINAIILPIVTTVIANPDAYGFLITRQEPDADDLAKGWLGRITAVDTRQFNAAVTNSEGFDVRMRYLLKTETLGTFNFYTTGSFTNHFLLSATPTAPIINTAGGSGPLRWRGNGSATWSRDHWSASITGRYVGHRSTNTTAPSSSFPSATQLDGGRIPAYLHWDLQMSYEIPYRTSTLRDWRTWIAGTRWTIGALNILNDEPAFVSDGSSFYNGADDPRQRYVYVQIKKSF